MNSYRHLFTNPIRKFITHEGMVPILRTIGVIGDSLSSGEYESLNEKGEKAFHDYYEYAWGNFIARKCGLIAHIFARGGLRCDTFFEYAEGSKLFTEEKKCQAYIIALGLNDLNHLEEAYPDGFGSLSDVDYKNEDNNKKSFIGQYVRIIQKLRKLSPKCRIFVMTIPKEKPDSKPELREKMRSVLLELPRLFEFLYALDLRKYAPIYDRKFREKYFCGGHMSASGYKYTADMVITYIDYIIRKNPKDFTQIGFVNKDVHNIKERW